MDPTTTPLGQMLVDEITPVVMVLRTPLVEEACAKNDLSFIQMLSPFCSFNNIDVPVRTSSDQPYRLQKFKLRLFYESDIRQPNLEVAKDRLKKAITHAGEKDDSELSLDPPPLSSILAGSGLDIRPSWFEFVNKELISTVAFSDHEAFDHPVACLLVVSSKDEQPINKFVDLFNSSKLPSLLNDGAMDPKILKHYLLVHDNQDDPSEKATLLLTDMRNTFGSNECKLLCINSSRERQMEHHDSPWSLHISDSSPGEHLGRFLNIDDINEIKDLMQEISTKQIIPYMEQKVRVLNQQISATRKGFRNQIKNLWWRKGKDETADSPSGPTYTFSSNESQIRILGDYAFMLRDYELALSNYRLISTDYKLDKAWKHYAGVQEMMGLTYFMLDQSRKDAEYCMENAFNTYLKIGAAGQQNATRCGLWWIEMLKTRDQYKEAATVYFRICSEEPLHSAVMLEQASYCFLLSQPPMLHKYGFHLVLSGDLYRKCDQIKHAIRTYRSATSVYKGTTWSYIKDHVHFHIGQWYGILGMYDVAVKHMLEVLACTHQSKTTQELFLRDFLQIVQNTGKMFEVLGLQLPVIKTSSLKVIYEDHRTYASATAASVTESFWHSLEEDIVPSLPASRTNWLEVQSKLLPKLYKESNICVAGEEIKVDIEFENPLKIPISISGVSLVCEHSASLDAVKPNANSPSEPLEDVDKKLGETSSSISQFTCSEVNLSLGGGQSNLVQLSVTPKIEGILNIVGVRWKLSRSVVGFYNFDGNVKKKSSKGRKKTKVSSNGDLKFVVIKSLPKLEGLISALPEKLYAGNLRHLVLELKNQSEISVKNLKIKVSQPRFLSIGREDDLNVDIPSSLEKKGNIEQKGVSINQKNVSHGVFHFPEDVSIQAGAPFSWPLWFRAAVPGNFSLHIVIYYEMGDESSGMKYRTLRMHYNLQVLPSVDVSFRIGPCQSRLHDFLVRMDIVNKTSSESFELYQLSSVGHQWEISLLQPVETIFPSKSLIPGQALSCFFKLKSCQKSLATEENLSSGSALPGHDVMLVSESSNAVLFDISCSPLADFHACERLQNGMSIQDASDKVDFILISRQLKGESEHGISEPPHLFSHHACHCSTARTSPISWIIDGPRLSQHDFSSSFCEINLRMTIYNSSHSIASVTMNSIDFAAENGESSDTSAVISRSQAGWYDVSPVDGIKVTSDGLGRTGDPISPESVSPFIWCSSSSVRMQLEPMSSTEVPLKICVFSPGTYDLSNYVLNWNIRPINSSQEDSYKRHSSGRSPGYPYYVTVLQSDRDS